MRKLLLGSLCLFFFALFISLMEVSCQKSNAQPPPQVTYNLPPATTSSLGGIIVGSGLTVTSNGTLSVSQAPASDSLILNKILYVEGVDSGSFSIHNKYLMANIDGSSPQEIPVNLPYGLNLDNDAKLTRDGKTIIFTVYDQPYPKTTWIYSCSIDGSNLKKLVDGEIGKTLRVSGAY